MSFVDDYVLTRSSVFRVLIALFILVTTANIIAINQVYRDSELFHRQQLTRQLNDEISEFSFVAQQSMEEVQKLLRTKQAVSNPFYYRLVEHNDPVYYSQYYPVSSLPTNTTNVVINDRFSLEVEFNEQALKEHKQRLIPIMFSGIILPVAIMLAAALFFTVLILKRLERVNKAMNRVLCGERDVRISVSQRDDEFDILAIHLNYMIQQISQNETALKSLTTGLAHDMRTPIARLKLRLEDILAKQTLNEEQQEQVSACHDELELLLTLFNSMLEIARLNSKQTDLKVEQVNLSHIAQDAMEFIAPIAEQKQQKLTIQQDHPCQVEGDRSLLFRAIFNLIENAVKYTPIGGEIQIIIDHFGVVVTDSGIGISDEDKSNVCKPMYRADQSRTERGDGLGLSLVDAVISRHGAKLIFRDNHPGFVLASIFRQTKGS